MNKVTIFLVMVALAVTSVCHAQTLKWTDAAEDVYSLVAQFSLTDDGGLVMSGDDGRSINLTGLCHAIDDYMCERLTRDLPINTGAPYECLGQPTSEFWGAPDEYDIVFHGDDSEYGMCDMCFIFEGVRHWMMEQPKEENK